jgi:hypothetical protein
MNISFTSNSRVDLEIPVLDMQEGERCIFIMNGRGEPIHSKVEYWREGIYIHWFSSRTGTFQKEQWFNIDSYKQTVRITG